MDTSSSLFTIRKIASLDNVRVKEIILTVMADFGCIGEGYSSSDAEVEAMFEAYSNNRSAFFVITDSNNIIYGCGGIGPLVGGETNICELKKMYFLPELRSQGMGQILIDNCLATAKSLGYEKCYLETLEAMEAANHLYHKNGFTKLQKNLGATGHGGCDAYFVKEI